MDTILFEICRMVAVIIGLVLAYYVIPVLKMAVIKHMDDNTVDFIKSCVYAAQQTLKDNELKKAYVLEQATAWLADHDVDMSPEQLDILIESTVLAMKTETR